MRKLFLIAAAILAFPTRGHASEPPLFDSVPLDDGQLDAARGGFTLPGGIQVDFGATISTSIDGARLLQTNVQFTDTGVTTTYQAADGVPVHIEGGIGASNGTISIGPTGGGTVTLDVETADLFIRHVVGGSIGSIIANTANGRTIDNQVSIDLKLDNVTPLAVGSGVFQIEAMGVDAASFRAP